MVQIRFTRMRFSQSLSDWYHARLLARIDRLSDQIGYTLRSYIRHHQPILSSSLPIDRVKTMETEFLTLMQHNPSLFSKRDVRAFARRFDRFMAQYRHELREILWHTETTHFFRDMARGDFTLAS